MNRAAACGDAASMCVLADIVSALVVNFDLLQRPPPAREECSREVHSGCGVLACVCAAGALCQRSVPSPVSSMALLCSHSLAMCLPHGVACRPLLEVSKHSSPEAMVSHARVSQGADCSSRFRSRRTRQHCELRYNVSRRHCLLHSTGGCGYSSTASRSCLRKPLRAHSKRCRPFNAAR